MSLIPSGLNVRSSAVAFCAIFLTVPGVAAAAAAKDTPGGDLSEQVFRLETAGDLSGARSLLQRDSAASKSLSARQYAEFLDRHHDSDARDAYRKWAAVESDNALRQLALRQVVLLDLMGGFTNDLSEDLAAYNHAGGEALAAPPASQHNLPYSTITVPGPLSSFARMAALSVDLPPEDLLSALARNIVTNGYEASGNELLQQTEYLRLLLRYVSQARELQAMAKGGKIVISSCDSEETGTLLKILGYRMRGSCGGDLVLETVNPTRAFLTIDSAFPLAELEQDLRGNHRFELSYAP